MIASPLKVGDEVVVPWGLEDVRGIVAELYGPVGRAFALVDVLILGSDGEELDRSTVSFPVESLRSVGAEA